MLGRWLAMVGILFAALGCEGHDCTAIGCVNGVGVAGEITDPPPSVVIEACLNDSCGSTSWDQSKAPGQCPSVNTPWGSAWVCFADPTTAGTRKVFGALAVRQVTPKNSDHYLFVITDADSGAVLGSVDTHVNYSDNYPNGPECDSEPCKNASIIMAPP